MWVYPSGWVVEKTYVSETFTCDLDLRELPFDVQECNVRVAANGFTSEKVVFWSPTVDIVDHVEEKDITSNQWVIDSTEVDAKSPSGVVPSGHREGQTRSMPVMI